MGTQPMKRRRGWPWLIPLVWAVSVIGCASQMQMGEGGSVVRGSAGAAGNGGTDLPTCALPIGTAALIEPAPEVTTQLAQVGLPTPLPVLKLIMQQSKCFRVVDRGLGVTAIQQEQQLRAQGLLKEGSQTAQGQMLAVQYLITPQVIFSEKNAGGGTAGALLGSRVPLIGGLLGGALASMKVQEAQVVLFVTDARSGEQIAAVEGSAKAKDFAGGGGLGAIGGGILGFGGLSGYGNTNEGKLIAAALLDAYRNLVPHLQVEADLAAGGSTREMEAASRGVESREALQGRQAFTPTTTVNLRSGPGTSYSVLRQLGPGTRLLPTGRREGSWWEVRFDGGLGWLSSRYIRETAP